MNKNKLIVLLAVICLLFCSCQTEPAEPSERELFLQSNGLTVEQKSQLLGKSILLDAGHGFADIGCTFPGGAPFEREITLILTQKIKAVLESDGIAVWLTHDGETFLPRDGLEQLAETLGYDMDAYLQNLITSHSGREGEEVQNTLTAFWAGVNDDETFDTFERCFYANLCGSQQPMSLYVSIHVNASVNNPLASGFDLFTCSDTPYDGKSRGAADAVRDALKHGFADTNARVKTYGWDDAYVVTKYPDMPSVLVESGFSTNETDAANLQNEAWQDAFARAVADGIELFLLGY
ncbi:MAG: N-acetylmuramoyl-L-alanine amidase [Clostridia bacterium]|nr:N-acetylmuramoyl-L-alanine amidase [Clostridia bacterium]